MNINRDYLIINDVKKSNVALGNGSMFFYITDKNTQNIFVNLVINVSNNDLIQKYANIENAEDYTLTMNIVKPSNTPKIIEGKLHDKEKAIFEFDLKEDCCDEVGTYRCELLTKCNINDHEEITTSNKLTYKVKSSVLNDLDNIVEAPQYPLVIQLFDKLSDIEQYEENRRANELARQLAEEQRQTRFDALDADMVDRITAMDDKMVDVENRVSTKEQAVDKLIVDTKADIDDYKAAKDQEIDEYKTVKDTEINEAIVAQDNKIDTAITAQNDRIAVVENNDIAQNNRLDVLENRDTIHESRMADIEAKNSQQDNRLDAIEAIDVTQNNRLDAIEAKNNQQDDRLLDVEKTNKRQDMDLKCLFAESKNNMIDVTEEGNSIYLQNSTTGYTLIDEIKGNTLVNCNKEPDKELILNGNINTSGDNAVSLTEGVDGGLVDVALEGNTLVNVSKTKDSTAISKAYTVENSGNHIALQGDVDGSCRPVITGNTLWIDNATGEVLTEFDEAKKLRLQSTFEDNLVTQEMVDNGEEVADNLGKYRIDYKVTGKNKFNLSNPETPNGGNFTINNDSIRYYATADELTQYNGYNSVDIELKLKPNTQYIFRHNVNITAGETGSACGKVYVYKNNTLDVIVSPNISKQILTDETGVLIFKFLGNWSSTKHDFDVTFSNIQIENGTEATSYEPYKEEYTKTLYLNSPLLEGDTIEEKDGGIYHVHRSEEVVFDGSEDWKTVNNSYARLLLVPKPKLSNNNRCENYMCDTLRKSNNLALESGMFINDAIRVKTEFISNAEEAKQWFAENPTTVVYELNNPTYELIEQSNLAIPSYTNGHLDFDTAVPVEKVEFKPFSEELTYLYANTQYTVQFISYAAITADVTLGGTQLLAQNIVKGLNRISITTPSELVDNKLTINGAGANIMEVIVTDIDRELEYFEGMKSVGEGKELQVISANSNTTLVNTQRLTHEPLRGIGDVKDRYVLIDGKWYIERKCGYRNNYSICDAWSNENLTNRRLKLFKLDNSIEEFNDINILRKVKSNKFKCVQYGYTDGRFNVPFLAYITENGNLWVSADINYTQQDMLNYINDCQFVYELQTPTYEPIDYNPLEVYSGTTHISTNSVIPTNIVVKNHGFNCLLKPSTTYTISSNLGLNTVTTPSTLTEDCLRFMDTDTSDVTTMKNVLVLEGDWTTKADVIPANFSGIESAFEQEYDTEKGKYKVNVKVANEDKTKENNITFYIDEPLRGVGTVKDRVFIQGDKVIVERKCGSKVFNGSDAEGWTVSGNQPISNSLLEFTKKFSECKVLTNLISNNFSMQQVNAEGFKNTSGVYNLRLFINKEKLQTEDVAGFKQWLQQNPTTVVYELAEPVYEEVEYNDVKLFIESFKNSTLSYNSNVPVTSKLYYSYSVPIVDTVAKTASISDEQDGMIIDLATQVAVMEMMLM